MLGRVLLGSVSSGLLHQTMRPVLIVRVKLCETATGTTCELACGGLFDRILFPTDFSGGSEYAFRTLAGMVAKTHSFCRLLHVQDETRLRPVMDRLPEFNTTDAARLEKMKMALVEAGASSVELELKMGKPTRIIVEEAAQQGHTLIVMSTRGRGALAEVMVGSVAMNVARLAPVPVLLVPSQC
jgi:nucleotide-binding universal stress UspA family protein